MFEIRHIVKPVVLKKLVPLDNTLLEEAYDTIIAGESQLDPTAPIKNEAEEMDGPGDPTDSHNKIALAELSKAYHTGIISRSSNYKLVMAMHIAQSVAQNIDKYPDLVRQFGTQIGKLYTP